MSAPDVSNQAHKQIRDQLIETVLSRVRGRHQEYCAFDRPRAKYFISSLAPVSESEQSEYSSSKPTSIGLKTKPTDDQAHLSISFDLYVPSFPTSDELAEVLNRSTHSNEQASFEIGDRFFRRFSVSNSWDLDLTQLQSELNRIESELADSVDDAYTSFEENHLVVRHTTIETIVRDLEISDPSDADRVRRQISDSTTRPPSWTISVDGQWKRDELHLSLINRSVTADDERTTDPYIFNPEIELEGTFDDYELSMIPEDYRYNRSIWGKGINCSIAVDHDSSAKLTSPEPLTLKTTVTPEYRKNRFKHNLNLTDVLSVSKLCSSEGLETALEAVETAMLAFEERWDDEFRTELSPTLTSEELEEFDNAKDQFSQEIRRFQSGKALLEEYPEVRKGFLWMNEIFNRADTVPSWYPFQFVFIVSNLSGIVSREHPEAETEFDDKVDVLWFPTGGGKTEAYLGLICFALLFDRSRGKNRGVTAWIRFPLRLLGQQQKDRFLELLPHANEVRTEKLEDPGERFELGFFAGSHDTPNSIRDDNNNEYRRIFQQNKDELRKECLVVETCPLCDGEVDVKYDSELNSVFHHCQAEDCRLDRLPIYVVDHDIYRNIPSILLGTLDKISIIGQNNRFANLLGNFTVECPTHGYGYAGSCPESSTISCDLDLEDVEEDLTDPIPSLHLIDEVHLLDEELGVFAGHYETLYLHLCRKIGGHEPKVVTSTATISAYDDQMKNIFQKDAVRFPEEGPTLDESFYGRVDHDDPERRYLGIQPSNKTHIYAVLDLVKHFHETIRDFREEFTGSEFGLSRSEFESVLEMYELSIVYFLKKTKKDRFVRSIKNQIKEDMKDEGYSTPITPVDLTADTEDLSILEELQHPERDENGIAEHETIAATSFIGHGVDVDRFNAMFFFGFPSETFQYIQASARTGRDVPGTVIDVFKPYDERDKHRFKYFRKSHQYLRRSVEPVSVDRWAKKSITKTFPGIFAGIFNQYFKPNFYRKYGVNIGSSSQFHDVISKNPEQYPEISESIFRDALQSAYGVAETQNEYFEDQIQRMVNEFWGYWRSQLGEKNYTTMKEDPMRSLRDIGDPGQIDIDTAQSSFYVNLCSDGGEE